MALDAIIPTAEAHGKLSEAERGHYVQKDGKFYLEVRPAEGLSLENTSGLRTALEKERSDREKHERALKAFEGLDPAKAREALTEVEKMRSWTPEDKVKDKINSTVKQVEEKHKTELEGEKTRSTRYRSQVEKLLIDSAAMQAINKLGGVAELLLPHVRSQTKVEELADGSIVARVVNPDGTPRISLKPGNTGPMDIDELVATLKAHPTFKVAFMAGVKSGTGSDDLTVDEDSNIIWINQADASDVAKYRRAREKADKEHKELRVR